MEGDRNFQEKRSRRDGPALYSQKAAMYDAFISYSRTDLAQVLALKRGLDEQRLHVFFDLDSLRAGQDWPPQIGGAVQDSRMMVLCWSA
jgi:hypothetical protein